MKAVVYDTFGSPDVLRFEDIPIPVLAEGEVLVRVKAASLNPYDWHFLRGLPYVMRLMGFGLLRPKSTRVVGSDMAGTVEKVGRGVESIGVGDDVFAEVGFGGCAEFVAVPEAKLARKPLRLSFAETAALPMAGQTALIGLRDKGGVTTGMRVLVNGASGGVGSLAVQIAKELGAEVVGVCSDRNADLVRSLGADSVIVYTRDDFTNSDEKYDVIFDTVGNHSIRKLRRVLTPKGTLLAPGAGGGSILGAAAQQLKVTLLSPFVGQKLVAVNDKPNQDLDYLAEAAEAGTLRPVIGRTFDLSDTAEAMRYLEAGHTRGKVVVEITCS